MKALPWILGILALIGITTAVIFIVKYNKEKKKTEAPKTPVKTAVANAITNATAVTTPTAATAADATVARLMTYSN